jgi:hypothetical protein
MMKRLRGGVRSTVQIAALQKLVELYKTLEHAKTKSQTSGINKTLDIDGVTET